MNHDGTAKLSSPVYEIECRSYVKGQARVLEFRARALDGPKNIGDMIEYEITHGNIK